MGQFTRRDGNCRRTRAGVLSASARRRSACGGSRQAALQARPIASSCRQGDALALPLRDDEWGTFDLAHAGSYSSMSPTPWLWFLRMVAAVRPGGRVVLADDDHDVLRLWPEPPGSRRSGRAASGATTGSVTTLCGPAVGEPADGPAVRPVRNNWLFFGSCAGSSTLPM